MGGLRYGTSSWGEKSWVGSFYPRGCRPGDFLSYYATVFDTVEADNTYYAAPAASLVTGWDHKTPAGFTLSAKFPRALVHAGEGRIPDVEKILTREHGGEQLDRFLGSMDLLGDKCGPLLLQFPYFNTRLFLEAGPFLQRLDAFLAELPQRFRYAVEVRNKDWVREPLLELLRARNVAFVLSEVASMPHPAELAEEHDLVTADFLYVRLIGDRRVTDRASIASTGLKRPTFGELFVDKSESLDRWAELLRPAVASASETFAYANNHYAGHGPATIRELVERLGVA